MCCFLIYSKKAKHQDAVSAFEKWQQNFHSVTTDSDMADVLHGQTGQGPCGYSVVFGMRVTKYFIILHAAKLFILVVGVL